MSSGSSSRPPRRDDRPCGRSSGRPTVVGRRRAQVGQSSTGSRQVGHGAAVLDDGRSGVAPTPEEGEVAPTLDPAHDVTPARHVPDRGRASLARGQVASAAPRATRIPILERPTHRGAHHRAVDRRGVRSSCGNRRQHGVPPLGAAEDAPPRRAPKPLDPEVSAELVEALGQQRGARLSERLAQASEALDRERFQEVASDRHVRSRRRRPGVSAAHEIVGLVVLPAGYVQAGGRRARRPLRTSTTNPALLPVIADCQRAQGRWAAVEQVWQRDQGRLAEPGRHGRRAHRRRRRTRRSGRSAWRARTDGAGDQAAQGRCASSMCASGTCSATCTTAWATRSRSALVRRRRRVRRRLRRRDLDACAASVADGRPATLGTDGEFELPCGRRRRRHELPRSAARIRAQRRAGRMAASAGWHRRRRGATRVGLAGTRGGDRARS